MLPYPAEEHAKMLAFDAGGQWVLVALRGSDRLRYGALARALGVARDRISPLSPDRVRGELGLEPGGVCPLVDRRVDDLPRLFCGSGCADATPELAAADLVAVRGASVVDIAAEP